MGESDALYISIAGVLRRYQGNFKANQFHGHGRMKYGMLFENGEVKYLDGEAVASRHSF